MRVDKAKCLYCGGCVGICPVDAIVLCEVVLNVDSGKCTKCESCVKYCPMGALSLEG